jgi:hypothetical protein
MLCRRDLLIVRRQAIVQGNLRPPDVPLEEVVEALREEVMTLRARLAGLQQSERHEPLEAPPALTNTR